MLNTPALILIQASKADLQDIFREAYECGFQDGQRKTEKTEVPLNRKEVARKFNRSVDYVDKHWRHLRHQPESGSAYWFASDIENFLKEQ